MHTKQTDEEAAGGLLHQGRAVAAQVDGQTDAGGQLHRDGQGDRRPVHLPAHQGSGHQSHFHVAQKGSVVLV